MPMCSTAATYPTERASRCEHVTNPGPSLHRAFTPRIHTAHSHRTFTPRTHTAHSHRTFTYRIHTAHSNRDVVPRCVHDAYVLCASLPHSSFHSTLPPSSILPRPCFPSRFPTPILPSFPPPFQTSRAVPLASAASSPPPSAPASSAPPSSARQVRDCNLPHSLCAPPLSLPTLFTPPFLLDRHVRLQQDQL